MKIVDEELPKSMDEKISDIECPKDKMIRKVKTENW